MPGFSTILNMSVTGGFGIVFVLLARLLLRRAPKIFSYALWAVVLFRLLCPVSVSSAVSLMGVLPVSTAETGRMEYFAPPAEAAPQTPLPEPSTETTPAAVPEPAPAAAEPDAAKPDLWAAAGWIWAGGAAVLLGYNLVQLLRLRRRLVGAVKLQDNVYLADHAETPFVLGLFRPKIYLPSTLAPEERSYILRHERHHIHRGDPLIRFLAFAALCIHWFNPLVWAAFTLSGRDMEMSCDEAVTKEMGQDIRAAYATSLLRLSAGKPWKPGTPLAFGEGDPKRRIRNIMAYRKPALWAAVAAVILCVVLTACLGVNPKEDGQNATPSEETTGEPNDFEPSPAPETSAPSADAPAPAEPADLSLFEGILAGEEDFVDAWTGEPADLSEPGRLFTSEPRSVALEAYAALDLDGDGAAEVVLRPENAPTYGFVILHARGGTVYGYSMPYRGFRDLKADGTFTASSGAGNTVIGTLVFGETACETVVSARSEVTNGADGQVAFFTINGKAATREDFEAALEEQDRKTDAVWYAMPGSAAASPEAQVQIGYLLTLDPEARRLEFDPVSYLTAGKDDDTLRALGVDPDSLPNGYYIHNPETDAVSYAIAEDAVCRAFETPENREWELAETDLETLAESLNTRTPLYTITVENGVVTEISERYLP